MGAKPNRSKNDRKQFIAWFALILIVGWLVINLPKGEVKPAKTKAAGAAVESAEGSTTTAPVAGGERIEVVAELLNLRSEPSAEARVVIGTLRKGLTAEVLEKQPGWVFVKVDDGRTGYVADQPKYVKFVGQ